MLFWAGLRGAVGVALAAGMKGPHAVALRTTVLVTVVITVVVFGGTIGRMIEILGIRTGVEEDDSDEEEEMDVESRLIHGNHKRSRSMRKYEGSQISGNESYRDRLSLHSSQLGSSESDSDSDLPPPAVATDGLADATRVWRDGQWFTVLDERYLLPVFSNATASRRQANKKAMKKRPSLSEADTSVSSDLAKSSSRRDYNASFTDILSELVAAPLASGNDRSPTRRRENEDSADLSLASATTARPRPATNTLSPLIEQRNGNGGPGGSTGSPTPRR